MGWMRRTVNDRDPAVWDPVRAARPSRLPGVTMAGFRSSGTTEVDHRAIPHPAVTLILEFGAGRPIVDDATGQRQRGSLVAGLDGLSGAVRVRGDSIECVQVRLSPVVGCRVLGASPADLGDGVLPLDDVWGGEVSRICEQLGDASSWPERFALTEAWLVGRRQTGPFVDPEVAWAWDRIVGSHGLISVDRLATEVGWSRKRLWSRFRSQLGLPPKRAAKLVRFDHAVHRLAAGGDPARVAVESGYADQSHLHRDVRVFTGLTPATVAGEPWLAADDIAWAGR